MMPYCARPPSHLAAQLQSPPPSLAIVDDSPFLDKCNATAFHSWRWRITALVAVCAMLIVLTMISAFVDGLPTGMGSVLAPSARESENGRLMTKHRSRSALNVTTTQQGGIPRSSRRRLQRIETVLPFSDRRILVASMCTNKDISIFQSPDGSTGIPRYAVQIMNNCMSDCPPSDIHVFCGWFASALLVNPNSFKRIGYNDCIVNGGKPLRHGETLRFTYANSFMYPLRFKSASFCK